MKSNKSIEKEALEEYDIKEMQYNMEESLKCENSVVYARYKKWLKDNGVLIDPRIRYPSYFGQAKQGVVGVSANKAIQKSRAVIAVPYDLLITVDKVRKIEELNKIIKQNPQIFKQEDDSYVKILVLFVSYELIKGEKSFYFPYLQISTGELLAGWETWTMYKLQNRDVMASLRSHIEEQERQFINFLSIYRRYSNIFPQELGNKEYHSIFERAHGFISSRAFGWSIPSLSLIPMADSFNHGNRRFLDHFLINIVKEKQTAILQVQEKAVYQKYNKKTNLAIMKDQSFNLSQEQLAVIRVEKKTKALKFIEKHKHLLEESQKLKGIQQKGFDLKNKSQVRLRQYHILHQQYKAGIHKLKSLHFYDSSCSEDNDTDEQTIFQNENKKQTELLHDLSRTVTQKNKIIEIKRYWNTFNEQASDQEESIQQQDNQSDKKQQILTKELKDKLYVDNQSSEVSSDFSEEQDDSYEWVYKLENQDKTYFVMETKQIIKENEHIYNFYGRRTNKFLLSGYNFVMEDNVYDSYSLRIKFDDSINTRVPASKLIFIDKKKENVLISKQIRLKRYRINIDLLNICRSYILLWNKKESNQCRIQIPFDRGMETKTLELYQQTIKHLIKEYTTSLEEDYKLQEGQMKYEERTALTLRRQYKKILNGQQALINKCFSFLKRWKVQAIQDFQQSQLKWVRRVRPYLINLQTASSL